MNLPSAQSSHSPSRWVVICGLVRDEAAMAAKLDTLKTWKQDGVIDGVVFSTWHGEIARYSEISSRFEAGEFVLVELEQPKVKSFGYTLHQSKTLYYALQAVPDGAMTLKIRPDLGLLNDQVRNAILGTDITMDVPVGWPKVFERKVLISTSFLDAPFYLNDIVFYGLKSDLLALASFDFSTEMVLANTAPEQFFFRGAFARQFPLLEAYLLVQPYFVYDDPEQSAMRISMLLESDIYLDVLALNVRFMRTYFRIGIIDPLERDGFAPIDAALRLEDLFHVPQAVPGAAFLPGSHTVMVSDERPLDAMIARRFARSELGKRFAAALERIDDPSYWRDFPVNPLHPTPALRKLEQRLNAAMHALPSRLDSRLDDTGRHFIVRGHSDRVGLTVETEETLKLHEEINHMRRQLDALRAHKRG